MTNEKQIPFLIQLLEDGSPEVQRSAMLELASFGPLLRQEIQKINFKLNSTQRYYIDLIFQGQKRIQLRQSWPMWTKEGSEFQKLESALGILSDFLSGVHQRPSLTAMLNSLAFSYRVKHSTKDPKQLANFLFQEKGLQGNEDDYYNPQNSNLVNVIKHQKGVPISLAAIYMLVGYRLGIDIEGCHFPGHFLARITQNGTMAFVDCYSAGQIIEENEIIQYREDLSEDITHILREKAEAESIVRRFLANLIRAYQINEDDENCELMIELFKDLEFQMDCRQLKNARPEDFIMHPEALFLPGQLVYHKRYGYRGIIVEIDAECMATDDWYYGNQTQPDRHQPWLHVLVDGGDQVTYVAQENLENDLTKEKVKHPLLSYFFIEEEDGAYTRNENPWPDTDF